MRNNQPSPQSSDPEFETFLKSDSETPSPLTKPELYTPWEKGRKLLEDYEIVRELGKGGMGIVYLVRRQGDDRLFAVKTLISSDGNDSRNQRTFIRELRTWIELPDHPHLASCCFFRTIEDRLAIFAEYVEGGSLKKWIRRKKLLKIADILDIGIQCARGLQVAHNRGVVHQDIKPANVLMTGTGIARITDFGLARAKDSTLTRTTPVPDESFPEFGTGPILVTTAGMTPAYCSPEQFLHKKLDPKTDMWSWAVSLMEMFTGEVTWKSGSVASSVLDVVLREGPIDPYPKMPDSLVALLRRCFREDPEERWSSMDEIVLALQKIYSEETGTPYSRPEPRIAGKQPTGVIHDRRIYDGFQWKNPEEWLRKALVLAGQDVSNLKRKSHTKKGTLKAQAIDDIELFEGTVDLFHKIQKRGKHDVREDLAGVLADKASVHVYLNDYPGALMLFDESLHLWEQLVFDESRETLKPEFSKACGRKAYLLKMLGETLNSEVLFRKTIKMQERLVYQDNHRDLIGELGNRYINIAAILDSAGRYTEAIEFQDKAIHIRKRLAETGEDSLVQELADAYWLKAMSIEGLGRMEESLTLYERAISIIKPLLEREDRPKYRYDLALLYMNKGTVLETLGKFDAGIALLDDAIELMDRLVTVDGRVELYPDYASILLNKGLLIAKSGENEAAIEILDRSIAIFDRMYDREGIRQMAGSLAHAYMCKAMALSNLERHGDALELCNRTITIYSQRFYHEGRNEYAGELARAFCNKAETLRVMSENEKALMFIRKSIALMEKMVSEWQREDILFDLSWTYMIEAQILDDLNEHGQAVETIDKSIALREKLVTEDHRDEIRGDLAIVRLYRAEYLFAQGNEAEARTDAREAVASLRVEIEKSGRRDLKQRVADAEKIFGDIP